MPRSGIRQPSEPLPVGLRSVAVFGGVTPGVAVSSTPPVGVGVGAGTVAVGVGVGVGAGTVAVGVGVGVGVGSVPLTR
jgi:hypothetical protein